MFTALLEQIKIAPAEGDLPKAIINQLEFIMSKLLQDEKVAALVEKEVTKAVKAETKRVLAVIKEAELPEDKAAAKAAKEVIKGVSP